MPSPDLETLTVRLQGRDFSFKSLPENRELLISAAAELDKQLEQLRQKNRMASLEQAAVLVAINLYAEKQRLIAQDNFLLN